MDATTLFLLNVTWLMMHELDAIQQHEWRFFQQAFFFFRPLSDVAMYHVFVAAHVPLLVLILANAEDRNVQIAFNMFLIIHAGLHIGLRNHPRITFNNTFSRVWIFGAVPLALWHLALVV